MSGPRTKRQFAGAASDPAQRQITSFFSPSTGGIISSTPSPPTKTPLNGPVLPGSVQTNLLNVGMRVRKSVQEGYKTGAQYSAFKLWEDNTAAVPVVASTPSNFTSNTIGGGMRELLPFSGIHKIGGLGIQPAVSGATTTDNDFDDMPGLTNSQESIFSNSSVTSAVEATERVNNNAKKRFFVNNEEPEQEWDGQQQRSWQDMEISPRSFGPAGFENRKWAMPKGKKNRDGAAVVGQENVGGGVMVVDGNDFEEASFLERMDDE